MVALARSALQQGADVQARDVIDMGGGPAVVPLAAQGHRAAGDRAFDIAGQQPLAHGVMHLRQANDPDVHSRLQQLLAGKF